jgi:hypothetical protein
MDPGWKRPEELVVVVVVGKEEKWLQREEWDTVSMVRS